MANDSRTDAVHDRRAFPRGGRRDGDEKKPWYMRRRLWLTMASLVYVAWRRVKAVRKGNRSSTHVAA